MPILGRVLELEFLHSSPDNALSTKRPRTEEGEFIDLPDSAPTSPCLSLHSPADTPISPPPAFCGVLSPQTAPVPGTLALVPAVSSTSLCSSMSEQLCDDIGLLLQSTLQTSIRCFSSTLKYSILTKHFKPNSDFKFPSRYLDGCQRSCQLSYLEKNPWFVYSKAEDGIFCLPCVLFANKDNLGQLVCKKFNYWTAKTSKFSKHVSTNYHQLAVTQAEALKNSQFRPQLAVDNLLVNKSFYN